MGTPSRIRGAASKAPSRCPRREDWGEIMKRFAMLAGGAWLLLLIVAGSTALRDRVAAEAPSSAPGQPLPVTLKPTTIRKATPQLLTLGKRTYEKQCVACHGVDGRGEGEAAYLLYPKPREFSAGKFEMVST